MRSLLCGQAALKKEKKRTIFYISGIFFCVSSAERDAHQLTINNINKYENNIYIYYIYILDNKIKNKHPTIASTNEKIVITIIGLYRYNFSSFIENFSCLV